jgi:long-chain acyl-CoA synthetase
MLFRRRVSEWSDRTAMREKVFGIWRDITWREYGEMVRHVAMGLVSLGLEPGDRVTIASENNPQWLYVDQAVLAAGGISVGIYPTDSPEQVEYIVNHCGAKFHIAENEEQLDKILEVRRDTPSLKKIVILDMEGLRHFSDPMTMSFDELVEAGREADRKAPERLDELRGIAGPDDPAIIIYTSGTTGPPKGAVLSHRNLISVVEALYTVQPASPRDEILTYLPLCHVAERIFSGFGPLLRGYVINFAESLETVPDNFREVSPTMVLAVPRFWEKFYSGLVLRMNDSTGFEKLAFKLAFAVGSKVSDYRLQGKEPPIWLTALFRIADWTVLRNLKKFTGLDRARFCMSGAAPISPDLLKFFHSLGLDMREVYGQTESGGPSTMHYPGDVKLGTVGKPLPGVEIEIADDGEIIIKGPPVFKGYFGDPEKTRETVVDGRLYTGDVGRVDEDGHVVITDRKKDIIITAGGKNITPSEIENQLKFSPYINDAVVIGDRRKYLSALIMVDDEIVMQYAQDNRIPFTTYASLTQSEEIVKLIEKEVDKVNKKFARVERIKRFRLIDVKLTTDDDEITPTGKLKRKFVGEKFKDLVESMY